MPNTTDINNSKKIIDAIECFTQRFDISEQTNFAFEIVNNLLSPDKIAILTLQDGNYAIEQYAGYEYTDLKFPFSSSHNNIVYFHAGLLDKGIIANYFSPTLYEHYPFDFCIPLIMDKSLYGLICVNKNSTAQFTDEERQLATGLMNLFTLSLTNYDFFTKLNETKEQLDQKIFSLLAIHHSSKALLSELSLEKVSKLAISIFSELTQSTITSFFIKDDVSENYILMDYNNVYTKNPPLEITLYPKNSVLVDTPSIIDLSNSDEKSLFDQLFYNPEIVMDSFSPIYIVPMMKDLELLGFVTLGKKINDADYDPSIFELINSLSASTYIAISNARYLEQINAQKLLLDKKLNNLITLNTLMKNINSANSISQISNLLMDTLTVILKLNLGYFALFDEEKNHFNIINSVNMKTENHLFSMTNSLLPLQQGDIVVSYKADNLPQLIDTKIMDSFIVQPSGCIIVPVYISEDNENKLLGALGIFDILESTLHSEERILIFESIANYIAPVLFQLQQAKYLEKQYTPNYLELFINKLTEEIADSIDFSIDLYVIHIFNQKPLTFNELKLSDNLLEKYNNVYMINTGNCFIISNESPDITYIEDELIDNLAINSYQLNNDFNNIDEFKKLFL